MAGSKRKIYPFIPALKVQEAVGYLSELINDRVDANDFMTLVKTQGLRVFVDVEEMEKKGVSFKEVDTGKEITPMGMHEVIQGVEAAYGESHITGDHLARLPFNDCPLVFSGQNDEGKIVKWEIADQFSHHDDKYYSCVNSLSFKPAEIQSLAEKLNGKTPTENQEEELIQLRGRVQELEAENEELKASGAVAGGLTFPYSTPELEAMCKASNRHWAGYSDEMRKPTQKEIRMDIAEALGMDPTRGQRKPVELAAAIKPKEYRET